MSRNEPGPVTESFDEWFIVDDDIRAYLRLSSRFAKREYDRIWNDIAHSPGDPDGPELPDLFHDAVEGLWPGDYEWMLHASVMKDAVTAFEVYLEKAAREVLVHHGLDFAVLPGRTPNWKNLREFYRQHLDVTVETEAVVAVRELRHLLTHLRGELRTEEQREHFGDNVPLAALQVSLTSDSVISALDSLAVVVREVDPVAWRYSWNRETVPSLAEISEQPRSSDGTA